MLPPVARDHVAAWPYQLMVQHPATWARENSTGASKGGKDMVQALVRGQGASRVHECTHMHDICHKEAGITCVRARTATTQTHTHTHTHQAVHKSQATTCPLSTHPLVHGLKWHMAGRTATQYIGPHTHTHAARTHTHAPDRPPCGRVPVA